MKRFSLLAALFLLTISARADIVVQNEYAATMADGVGGPPTVTVAAGANLLACANGSTDDGDGDTEIATGGTFDGEPMTLAEGNDPFQLAATEIWYIFDPNLTTAAPVLTYNDANSDASWRCYVLEGAHSVTPIGTTDSNGADSSTVTVELAIALTEAVGAFGIGVYTADIGGSHAFTWTDLIEDGEVSSAPGVNFTFASALFSTTNAITPGVTGDAGSGDQSLSGIVVLPAPSGRVINPLDGPLGGPVQ